jgi:hypothetical protein
MIMSWTVKKEMMGIANAGGWKVLAAMSAHPSCSSGDLPQTQVFICK